MANTKSNLETEVEEYLEACAAARIFLDLVEADRQLRTDRVINQNQANNVDARTVPHITITAPSPPTNIPEPPPNADRVPTPAAIHTTHTITVANKKASRTPIESAERMRSLYSRLRAVNGVQIPQKKPVVFKTDDTHATNVCPICGHLGKRPDHLKEHFPPCAEDYGNPTAACWDDNVTHRPNTDNFRVRDYLHRQRQGAALSAGEQADLLELSSRKEREYERRIQRLRSEEATASQTQTTNNGPSDQEPRKRSWRRQSSRVEYHASAPEDPDVLAGDTTEEEDFEHRGANLLREIDEPMGGRRRRPGFNPAMLDHPFGESEPRHNDHSARLTTQTHEPQPLPTIGEDDWEADQTPEELLEVGRSVKGHKKPGR